MSSSAAARSSSTRARGAHSDAARTPRERSGARLAAFHRAPFTPSFRYDAYKLYKYNHTVPIYIFYATVCDNIDVTVQSRVPLPGLKDVGPPAPRCGWGWGA